MKHIYCIILMASLYAFSFLPEDGQEINYTQVFFVWPQIPNEEMYTFIISDDQEFSLSDTTEVTSNSILYDESLDWGSTYFWKVCGQNLDESCLTSKSFAINSLPAHHADQITINHLDEGQYTDGVNILDFESLGYSLAIDKYGEPIWFAEKENFHMDNITVTQFLDNGNLIGFANGRGYEFTLDSDIMFETPIDYSIHHQISKTNHGTYFFIDAEIEYHDCPMECDESFSFLPIPWQGDRYVEIDSDGALLWDWNTFDQISLNEYNPHYAETYNGVIEFDWTHSNSVIYDEASSSVYVSIRNLSRVTSIDYLTGDINWDLGESDYMESPSFENEINFSQQHSAQLTPDGNLIFFDNARFQDPEHSRCVEVGFDSGEPYLVWEHVLPENMFTGSRGECDRLPTGNSLISAGRTGNVIEVNSNNEVVWHLGVQNSGANVSIYRTERVRNLFPSAFSFEIRQISGNYDGYELNNDGNLEFTIYNHGWAVSGYEYELYNELGETILEGTIDEDSDIIDVYLDISSHTTDNSALYTLSVNPAGNELSASQIGFYFSDLIAGDINSDLDVNIQDVIELQALILAYADYGTISDLNEDQNTDILDIISLVNIILTDNN